MSEAIIAATDDTFQAEVLDQTLPVLVDFWAEWCGPCRAIAPVLDDIAQEYAGKIRVVKVNIDDSPQTPTRFGVRSIPTLILFKQGNVAATKVGSLQKSQLSAFIDSHL